MAGCGRFEAAGSRGEEEEGGSETVRRGGQEGPGAAALEKLCGAEKGGRGECGLDIVDEPAHAQLSTISFITPTSVK
jgi:hypothetical protein